MAFFLYGPAPKYVIKGSRAVRDGELNLRDYGDDEDIERFMALRRLFSEPLEAVSTAQREAVGYYLGKDADTDARQLQSALRQSPRSNLPRVGGLYLDYAGRLLRRFVPVSRK